MKISKIILTTLAIVLSLLVMSYGIAIRELSERAKSNVDLNYLYSLTKGSWFVSEVGTGDYALTSDIIGKYPELKTFSLDAANGRWYVRINKRTNSVHFIWGSGIELFERGKQLSRDELDRLGRNLISKYSDLFPIRAENLVLDRMTGRVVKDPNKYFIRYFITHNGVPLHRAFIFFRISHGRLIQIGMTGLEGWQWIETVPKLSEEEAIGLALHYARMSRDYRVVQSPTLKIVPTTENALAIAEPATPYNYRLVYELGIEYKGIIGRWLSWIDAHTGEVILFMDSNRYVQKGKVMGAVFIDSVDSNLDTVPGENCYGQRDMDEQAYVPFFLVTLRGLPVYDPLSDFGGMYYYSGIGTASCSLDGRYFDANDIYFGYDLEIYADDNNELDIGSGGVDFMALPMKQNPTSSAVRNGYYHLNRAHWLTSQWIDEETLPWLGETVPANMNILDECNAYSTGDTVNFFVSSELLGGGGLWACNNTGQIASVMMHEWGHCLDAWAGQGHGEFATGEGHADVMAFFNSHENCLGPGFFVLNQCCRRPPCNDTTYYAYMANTECRAKGALRSEENFEDQYSYTLVPEEEATTSNIMTRCYPGGAGVPGPLGREVHCEGQIFNETIWDLVKGLQQEPEHLINGGWKYAEYLYYGAVNYGAEVYLTLMPDNYYDALLAVDDDDGNLINGTPHAAIIHDAYASHDLFTPDALPTTAHCIAPIEPTLSAQIVSGGIKLSWTEVNNADKYILYWLYKNEHGPAYLLYEGKGNSYTYQVDIPGTYYFAIQAVSADGCPSTLEGVVSETIGTGMPDVKITDVAVSDDPPNGNGDGYGDVGETVEFSIELYNQGVVPATGLTVELEAISEGVILINNTSTYPDIGVGGSAINDTPYKVYLTKALPCGANVKFRVNIVANERIMDDTFEVMMGSLTDVYFNDFETPLGTEWVMDNDSQLDAKFTYIPDATIPPWYHYPHSGTGVLGWDNCPYGVSDDRAILKTNSFWNQFNVGEFAGLSFWHVFGTEAVNDGLVIEISVDNGVTWSDLRGKILYGGYNTIGCKYSDACWSKDLEGYCLDAMDAEVLVDLSAYAGKAAPWIRWRARANEECDCYYFCVSDYASDGWLIDDVAFKKCTIAGRPAIEFISASVNDSGGNNDGGIDQGEQVDLVLALKNVSTSYNLTNVLAELIAKDKGVVVIDNSGAFGDIPAGSTGDNSSDPFTIYYAGPCKDELSFQLNIASDQGDFALEIKLSVGGGLVFYDDVEAGQHPDIVMTEGWKIYTDGQFATSGMNSYYIDDFSFMQEHFLDLSASLPEANKITMTFNQTFAFEDFYDGARMYISDDGGSSWTDLGPYMISGGYNENWYYDGEPIWTTNPYGWGSSGPPPPTAPDWSEVKIDLSQWAGKDVIIEWWVFSDIAADSCYPGSSCPPWPHPNWGDGLVIDDIKIDYEQTCNNCAFPEFTDIATNFAKDYIRKLQCSAVASGCAVDKYCPEMVVSRQQMAKFIITSAQLTPSSSCQGIFTDVAVSNIFCIFIEKLANTGIASGCTTTKYCPNDPVTRAQMAVFLIRAMGLPPALSCTGMFDDVSSANPFCTYIEELANQGITSGCGAGLYCPSVPVKRDQMAVFLVKAFNL